ncbi:MAG TPA: hypothetical protein VGB53_10870 [Rubricoccaceae bacterium]|jgi:hypothetical protein
MQTFFLVLAIVTLAGCESVIAVGGTAYEWRDAPPDAQSYIVVNDSLIDRRASSYTGSTAPQMPYRLLLSIAALALASNACAQAPTDTEARRVLAEWLGEDGDRSESLARFSALARAGCNEGRDMSGIEYGECQSARLALAEAESTAASRAYEDRIAEPSAYAGEAYRAEVEGEWRTVWAYGQRRCREGRDADCVALGFSYQRGSGTSAGMTQCRADRTFEGAAQV